MVNVHGISLHMASLLSALGRVDGFDEDEAESKSHESAVVLVNLLAS
jgi:hypothetical protein